MGAISVSSILGILLGFGLLSLAVVQNTDNYTIFVSGSSFLLVFGGTIASAMISYNGRYVLRALRDMLMIFIPSHVSPQSLMEDVAILLRWSQEYRTHQQQSLPLFQLEEKFLEHEDPDSEFTKLAFSYILSNYKGPKLSSLLNNLVNTMFERSQVQVRILRAMSEMAPAFGMAGTVIGLIIMLSKLKGSLDSLGIGMALALLTTLYGLMISQLIFKPAASKLEQKNEMRRFRNELLTEGFVMIADKRSSLEIQDKLNSFLEPRCHFDIAMRESPPTKSEKNTK